MNRTFKIIIVGDSGVGKTCLIKQYVSDKMNTDNAEITIGIDFWLKTLDFNGENTKVQFWDTAGQDQFKTLIDFYYKEVCAAIIVFDITRIDSCKSIEYWMKEIHDKNSCKHDHPILLLGNKSDCESQRLVSHEDIVLLAARYNMLYFDVSAKENLNIDMALNALYGAIHQNLINDKHECKGIRERKPQHEYQESLKLTIPHRRCPCSCWYGL